eukprot:TRINITY_DN48162_c0_g1_i1.p1 TRINITY_DN48162_c0_g1~~TRINITY_DN48162_c0_g1_i1.p1  ORF type:complete len:699 (+),score=119.31 TRINITY_DN48162_c0_g1_i1:72-2168(+)
MAQTAAMPACTEDGDVLFEYWAGNPTIEIAHGFIRAEANLSANASLPTQRSNYRLGDSPGEACKGVAIASTESDDRCEAGSCVLLASSVPCHMSAPEFCEFVGAFADETHRDFRNCRVFHGNSPDDYLIALQMSTSQAAVSLIERYNGHQFNKLEPHTCVIQRAIGWQRSALPVEDNSPENAQRGIRGGCTFWKRSSPTLGPMRPPLEVSSVEAFPQDPADLFSEGCAGLTVGAQSQDACAERNFCAVCLENIETAPGNYQLSELGGGVPLTILCTHTFHSRCLSRWCDATCPVCRFQQHPYRTSSCDVCGNADDLHICLVCGSISCMSEGHARQHFEATSHTYAVDVSTQHVWDYAGDGYVHRLLFNQEDGKVVEHSMPIPEDGLFPPMFLPEEELEAHASGAAGSVRTVAPRRRWSDMVSETSSDTASIAATPESPAAASVAARAAASEIVAGGGVATADSSDVGDGCCSGPAGDVTSAESKLVVTAAVVQAASAADDLVGLARTDPRFGAAKKGKESMVSEFNALLASQMTAQRSYHMQCQREQEALHARRLKEQEVCVEEVLGKVQVARCTLEEVTLACSTLEKEIAAAVASEELAQRQKRALEGLNEKISQQQRSYEGLQEDAREQQRAARLQRSKDVEDLQEQIRDLERFLKMRKQCVNSATSADRQGSHVIITESAGPSHGRGGRRGARRR